MVTKILASALPCKVNFSLDLVLSSGHTQSYPDKHDTYRNEKGSHPRSGGVSTVSAVLQFPTFQK